MALDSVSLYNGRYLDLKSPLQYPYEMIVPRQDCVCVLPIIKNQSGLEVVVRKEWCPPYFYTYGENELTWTLVTGGVEEDEDLISAMERELREEVGIYDARYDIIENSKLPIFKNTTAVLNFFIIELKEYKLEKPVGDGTFNESQSQSLFLKDINFLNLKDKTDLLFSFAQEKIKNLTRKQ